MSVVKSPRGVTLTTLVVIIAVAVACAALWGAFHRYNFSGGLAIGSIETVNEKGAAIPTDREMHEALDWLLASDRKFQQVHKAANGRALNASEINLLMAEISPGEKYLKVIKSTGNEPLAEEFSQYLTTLTRVVDEFHEGKP